MRVIGKLTIALTCAILLVLGLNAALRVQREIRMFEADGKRDGRVLGRSIAGAAERVWHTAGESQALDLVANANERESQLTVRWVWLAAPAGDPHAPDVPHALLEAALAERKIPALRFRPPGKDTDYLYSYTRIAISGPRTALLELRESLAPEQGYVSRTILQASIATIVLVLLCSVVALGLGAHFVGRPVRQLVEQARRVGAGDLTARLHLTQRDEIGELANEMNAMCEHLSVARERLETETAARLRALDQLRHADRLTTVGRLASGIAHEVGTPLNVITGHCQLITDEHPRGSSAHENAVIVAQQAHRVASIIRQLLDFARPRSPARTPQDLGPIVSRTGTLLESTARKLGLSLTVELPPTPVTACVDDGQMQQALMNLVMNAFHATPEGGTVTIALCACDTPAPEGSVHQTRASAQLSVVDSGDGISPEVLPRIFEPFFTTKEVGLGTGLGLSVTYGIVRDHGGWIDVESSTTAGSRFSILLPAEETTG